MSATGTASCQAGRHETEGPGGGGGMACVGGRLRNVDPYRPDHEEEMQLYEPGSVLRMPE